MTNVEHGGHKKFTYPDKMGWGEKGRRDECYRIRRQRHRANGGGISEPSPLVTTWQFRCAICLATFDYKGRHEGRGGTRAQEKGWRYCHSYGWVCPCERSLANRSFINPYSREFLDRAPTDKELKDAQPFPEPLPHWQMGTAFDGLNEIVAAFVAATDEMEEIMAATDEIEKMHHQLESAVMWKGRTLPDDEMGSGPQVRVKRAVRQVRKEFFRLLKSEGIRAALSLQMVRGYLELDHDGDCLVNVVIRLTHERKGFWRGGKWWEPRRCWVKSVIPFWEHYADMDELSLPALGREIHTLVADLRRIMGGVHDLSLDASDFNRL